MVERVAGSINVEPALPTGLRVFGEESRSETQLRLQHRLALVVIEYWSDFDVESAVPIESPPLDSSEVVAFADRHPLTGYDVMPPADQCYTRVIGCIIVVRHLSERLVDVVPRRWITRPGK